MKPSDRIIFALDVPDRARAGEFIRLLDGHVGAVKIGLELFIACGPAIIKDALTPVMLDLKLHDIPETVERSVLRAGDLGVKFLTLHVQQRETMRRAAKAAEKTGIQLLAVTVLTSMTSDDLLSLMQPNHLAPAFFDPSGRAIHLAKLAWEEGITGFVCSPQEAKAMKSLLHKAIIVTPGVRPAGSAAGDQKRTGTPSQAISDGADYIVVGRPIRDAEDPVKAAQLIASEIEIGLLMPPDPSAGA